MKKSTPTKTAPAQPTSDSFQNFAARIGIGTGKLSGAGTYTLRYLSRDSLQA